MDDRTHNLTPFNEVPHPDLIGWHPDVERIPDVTSHWGIVLAETEEDAQRLCVARYADKGPSNQFKSFINADMPVKRAYMSRPYEPSSSLADVLDVDFYVQPEEVPEEQEVE